mmetsp:Transcript_63504/g.151425  ORF Transcript_63504/g.151425 Transcript_63504/m.151425 type:complete len:86 (+) Transcript_63504:71-328(+)
MVFFAEVFGTQVVSARSREVPVVWWITTQTPQLANSLPKPVADCSGFFATFSISTKNTLYYAFMLIHTRNDIIVWDHIDIFLALL